MVLGGFRSFHVLVTTMPIFIRPPFPHLNFTAEFNILHSVPLEFTSLENVFTLAF